MHTIRLNSANRLLVMAALATTSVAGSACAQNLPQGRFGPLYLAMSKEGAVTGALNEKIGDGDTSTFKQCALLLRGSVGKGGYVNDVVVQSLGSKNKATNASLKIANKRAVLALPDSLPGCSTALDLSDAATRGFLFREAVSCSSLAMIKPSVVRLVSHERQDLVLQRGDVVCVTASQGRWRHIAYLRKPEVEGEIKVSALAFPPK